MTTTVSRQSRKEDSENSQVIEKLMTPIRNKIKSMTLVNTKCDFIETQKLKDEIEVANRKYNQWATKFNRRSKQLKSRFNAIRDIANQEFRDHEFQLYKSKLIEVTFERFEIPLHVIEKIPVIINKCFDKNIPFEDAAELLNAQAKRFKKNEIFQH